MTLPTETTPAVLHACYVPASGTVYRIEEPGLRDACSGRRHVEFSWTDGAGALLVGDAAGGDLAGDFPDPTVVALLGRALSTTPPTDGQVLVWDEANQEWTPADQTGGGGASDHGDLNGLADDDHEQYLLGNGVRDYEDGFAVTGAFGTGAIPASGAGVRLMWYPAKAAFRAGEVSGNEWNDANVGGRSVAFGDRTVASGNNSTALGASTRASGNNSTAMGLETEASGREATAMGDGTVASGLTSTAMGRGTVASGNLSTAMGFGAEASGDLSTAVGSSTEASGFASTAMGSQTDGVSLLAIQALERPTRALAAENEALRSELAELRARIERLVA